MIKKLFLWIFIGLGIYSCQKVPLTGRNQLSLVDSEELLPLAYNQYDQILKEYKVVTNTPNGQMVVKVGKRVASAVERFMKEEGYADQIKGFAWEFNLLQDDQVNAFAMPGGKVAFFTGIMPYCQNETGVAVVMGHEVAHAIASHGGERMSNGLVLNGLLGGVQAAMGQNPSLTQNIFLQAAGIGGQLGMLKYSRKHELEADRLGLIFMAMAGYDPRVAPDFWERMNKDDGERPPEFLSTHPGPDKRINKLNARMDEAMEYYNKSQQN